MHIEYAMLATTISKENYNTQNYQRKIKRIKDTLYINTSYISTATKYLLKQLQL